MPRMLYKTMPEAMHRDTMSRDVGHYDRSTSKGAFAETVGRSARIHSCSGQGTFRSREENRRDLNLGS